MGGQHDDSIIDDIEQLLESGIQEDIHEGVRLTDIAFREKFCGILRKWSDENGVGLTSGQLPLVWLDVLFTLYRFASTGKFRANGRLIGLLFFFGRWRAYDLFRGDKRVVNDDNITVDREAVECRVDQNQRMADLIMAVELASETLAFCESIAINTYCTLAKENGGFPPTYAELVHAVQLVLPSATAAGVKSALQRARVKMRNSFGKGY